MKNGTLNILGMLKKLYSLQGQTITISTTLLLFPTKLDLLKNCLDTSLEQNILILL